MKYLTTVLCLFLIMNSSHAQKSPFASITELETDFTAGNVAARMIEGLGFRYYWATEGLTEKDLKFAPVEEGRNSKQTIEHLYGLSRFLMSALEKETFTDVDMTKMTFKELRNGTLKNLEKAVSILKNSKESDFKAYNIKFANGGQMPFWNAINGPMSDAVYHTGQIVLMRRMSGNPINPNISVLTGSVR